MQVRYKNKNNKDMEYLFKITSNLTAPIETDRYKSKR